MARPLRIEFPGAWYHAMNRVAGRKLAFCHRDALNLFVKTLAEGLGRYDVECHAWCLMSNHYHLLLHTPHGNLSCAMRHINSVFTQRFNRLRHRDGPLFRGRYRAQLIEADAYLLRVSRYIHRNPLEAGMASNLARYPWTSFPAYVGAAAKPSWLETRAVLEQMDHSAQRYRGYVQQTDSDMLPDLIRGGPVLGSESFRECMLTRVQPDPEVTRAEPRRRSSNAVLWEVAAAFETTVDSLLNARRGRGHRNPARAAAMRQCLKRVGMTQKEVAELFGVKHYATVAMTLQRLDRWLAADPALRAKLENLS